MADLISSLVKITWNVNDIGTPIKRQRLAEWPKKCDSTVCSLQETHFKYDISRLKVKGQINTCHVTH